MSHQEKNSVFWYVAYTRPRWEKKVSAKLSELGFVNYCPLNRVVRQWSDRKKTVYEPLFKGYVFIQVDEKDKWEVKSIEGIVNYVHWLGKPAKVKSDEIDLIKKFLKEFESVEVVDYKLDVNSKVIINEGLLMDYKGIVLEVMGNKVRVKIHSMSVDLIAIFDRSSLHKMETI